MIKMSAMKAALAIGVAMGTMPMAALAQSAAADGDEAQTAEEMVVVGQRQQYRGDVPLSAIPQSVSVIDAKTLQNLNITRLDTALDLSSGVARQNNFGGLFDGFAIRGFAGDENFAGGVLVNGFNAGRGYGGPRDASNIEKIEILKGPNGAVFGRGEPGGTISIITKKAKVGETFGSFAVQGGSWNTFRVEADYNLSLSDTVAIRVNGAAQDGDSFRDVVRQTLYTANPSIVFTPSKDTSISYELEFMNNRVPFDRGTIAVNGQLGVVDRSTFFGEPGDGRMEVNVLGHQVQFQQKLGGNWYFLAGLSYRETEFKGFSSEPELDPIGTNRRQTLGKPGNFLARQRRSRDYSTDNLVVRGEISGNLYTGGIKHHVLVGADWDRFRIDLLQLRGRPVNYTTGAPITAANYAVDIFNPVYGQTLALGAAPLTNTFETQKAWGIYFQDQIDLTDRLKLRVGGRYDNFNQTVLNRANNRTTIVKQKQFSPTGGVLFEINDDLSIFGGYGEGYRPNSGVDAASNPFPAELSKSYEVGLRLGEPGGPISGSIAAFTMTKNNILTADPNPANAGFSIAGGAARSRGIELDFNANLPGDIMVIATYAYLDANWTTQAGDKDFGLTINPGDRLINIPAHAANLIASKGFMIGERRFTLGGGINYVGKRLGETGSTFELPGYVVARLMASFEPSDGVKLTADVTNLFDKQFYTASYARLWVAPGAPRAFNVRATFSF
ncbi:MAG: TonB-dependent siderophore receptor [Novosphingobium sp. 28-62-57]|uniref:TonB-dependent siderophore receptor n=2 Tax=unclassified Novosphingobium TaxID=2644732 RepID=UPI000BD2D037|nr:TonB-dependent siderophore receptor [Novosphingobium sp.]OYW48216.1 MAG: TonB-dependent siderophore receptor [Novosphingobium sp. 12-63-9]OYZ08963.1 MAG: TonB-dependent siderophore receptor [Novosphingobium sp. 28-62-57]OZA39652.1 MAG: TonB-dependent siderophore receptor [Novosphingobium sp. 17-62-9]HQS68272.1 TonB-dependent siderophore receptor [Novosphingobium sp.]